MLFVCALIHIQIILFQNIKIKLIEDRGRIKVSCRVAEYAKNKTTHIQNINLNYKLN